MTTGNHIVDSLSSLMAELTPGSEAHRITKRLMEQFRDFVTVMDGNTSDGVRLFWATVDTPSTPLFREVGKLVRTFTDQMKVIRSDIPNRLGEIAQHDMGDAAHRLSHIVEMTETAANQTMDLAERMNKELEDRSSLVGKAISRIDSALAAPDLPPAATDVLRYLYGVCKSQGESDGRLQSGLTDVLVAQGYQDLTGQIIQKIITLLGSLEHDLIGLVETFGRAYAHGEQAQAGEMHGPRKEADQGRQSQDDVDSLLDSLGF